MTYAQLIKHYGSPAKVAAALHIQAPSVYGWREGIPFLRQIQIERETDGELRATNGICDGCGNPNNRCNASPSLFCMKCLRVYTKIKGRANGVVAKAVREGRLRPIRECACAECGKPAYGYDHRYYAEPLRVRPLCRSCGYHAGPARDAIRLVRNANNAS